MVDPLRIGLVLVIAAAFFLRRSPQQDEDDTLVTASAHPAPVAEQYAAPLAWTQGSPPPATVAPIPPPPPADPDPETQRHNLLNSLKEELFALSQPAPRGTSARWDTRRTSRLWRPSSAEPSIARYQALRNEMGKIVGIWRKLASDSTYFHIRLRESRAISIRFVPKYVIRKHQVTSH